jgi:hypothetical protein
MKYCMAVLLLMLTLVAKPQARGCDFCGCPAQCAFSDTAPLPPDTSPFTIQGGRWSHQVPGQPLTLTYSYRNMFDGGLRMVDGAPLPESYIRGAIEEALLRWAEVVPIHFVEVEDDHAPFTGSNYTSGQFGQIRFSHRYINGPDVPGEPPKAKALAYFPSGGGNLAGDVFFDNGDPWSPQGTIAVPDILGAAIHEVGHTLGLGHTNVADANMYWTFLRTSGLGTSYLHADDIAGIRLVYGMGVGSVTPLATAVPEPASLVLVVAAAFVGLAWRVAVASGPQR